MGLAFQVAFIVIARDPVRLRPMMIPSVLEKFGYGATLLVLYLQNRLHPQDLGAWWRRRAVRRAVPGRVP
jgi:hypothetical protein